MTDTNSPIILEKQHKSEEGEEEYEDNFDSPEKEVVIEQKEPEQRLISLVRMPDEINPSKKKEQQIPQQEKVEMISKLKNLIHERYQFYNQHRTNQIKGLKRSITKCKMEIKSIGNEVDKEMNKSVMKHSKPYATVSIHDIFTSASSQDPQVLELSEELTKIRSEVKKIKQELKTYEIQLTTPVSMLNQERAFEYKTKIKSLEVELQDNNREKQYIETELKLLSTTNHIEYEYQQEQIQTNKEKNYEYISEIKDERHQHYEIEKEDRTLMEKIRFLEEVEEGMDNRKMQKVEIQETNKMEIEEQMKNILKQINQVLQERNKVENQRRNILKNLTAESSNFQSKNWEMINKLRQIDAYLIKHYSSRVKKVKVKREKANQIDESLNRAPLNETAKLPSLERNDKNISFSADMQPVQLVQKRKSYEFGTNTFQKESIFLSDDFLGTKIALQSLSFTLDEEYLYGFCAEYSNDKKKKVQGYNIVPKIKPKDAVIEKLKLDCTKGQLINFLHVGSDKDGQIKYLQVITSEGKQFKWGSLDKCEKNEQKSIRKYESISLKGKLVQLMDKDGPNYYCLGGIGVSIIYLSQK